MSTALYVFDRYVFIFIQFGKLVIFFWFLWPMLHLEVSYLFSKYWGIFPEIFLCLISNNSTVISGHNLCDLNFFLKFFSAEYGLSWSMFCVYLERMCILLFIGLSYQCQLGQMINSVVQLFCIITDFLSFFISVTERVVLSIISCLYISYFSSTSFCFT